MSSTSLFSLRYSKFKEIKDLSSFTCNKLGFTPKKLHKVDDLYIYKKGLRLGRGGVVELASP